MYIRLNSLETKSPRVIKDDGIILSQIIDSGVSYEKPVLLRSAEELDIWFGKNFKEYGYFRELIKSGIVLYLFRPINSESNEDSDNFIKYKTFPVKSDPKTKEEILYYSYKDLPASGKEGVRYKIVSNDGNEIDKLTGLPVDYLIWHQSNYILVKYLPQNLEKRSISNLNRDTLRIHCESSGLKLRESYPKYSEAGLDDYTADDLNITTKEYVSWFLRFNPVFLQFPQFDPDDGNIPIGQQAPYIALTDSRGVLNVFFYSFGKRFLSPLKTSFEKFGISSDKVNLINLNESPTYSWDVNDLGFDIIVKIVSSIPTVIPDMTVNILNDNLTVELRSSGWGFKVISNISTNNPFFGLSEVLSCPIDTSIVNDLSNDDIDGYLIGLESLKYNIIFPDQVDSFTTCPFITFPNKKGELFAFYYEIPNIPLPKIPIENVELISLNSLGYNWESNGFEGMIKGALKYIKNSNARLNEVTYESSGDRKFRIISNYSIPKKFIISNIDGIVIDPITILPQFPESTMSDLRTGLASLNLKLKFSSNFLTYPTFVPPNIDVTTKIYEYPFVSIPRVDGKFAIFYYKTEYEGLTGFIGGNNEKSLLFNCEDLISDYIPVSWNKFSAENNIISLIKAIRSYLNDPRNSDNVAVGFRTNNYRDVRMILSYPIRLNLFSNIPDSELQISNDMTSEQSISRLSRILKEFGSIEFYSKTIGNSGEGIDGDITVSIENIKENYSRITIHRYGYTEVFEGPLNNLIGEERLDLKITRQSKLVYCNILSSDIPEGSWRLLGSTKEISSVSEYWRSFEEIMLDDNSYIIDYFLIPDIYCYVSNLNKDKNYYVEYLDLLDISSKGNCFCQFLIQNLDSKFELVEVDSIPDSPELHKVYKVDKKYFILNSSTNTIEETVDRDIIECKGDYVHNYIGDAENRLIYFFRTMTIDRVVRPGYYVFLRSLFENTYSYSESRINYECPSVHPYLVNSLERELESFKCNYLVDNNHQYYYESLQNGDNYSTTIWMRFCIGKVRREMEKRKDSYLALSSPGKIRSSIENILDYLERSFPIIKDLRLESFDLNLPKNRLEVTIKTVVNDLVSNDLILDLTINYNK